MENPASIKKLHVYEPYIGGEEAANLAECASSGWVSYLGPFVSRFEADIRAYTGASNATAVNSGSAALHLTLVVLGVGQGDEVLVPDLTFAASGFAVIHAGAKPVFCDIDRANWTLDIDDASRRLTPNTKAIMPVHLLGHPCDMDRLMGFADANNLLVIEDAAQSLGCRYKGTHTGTFGHAGCFSFNGNKLVTSGGGGMVVFRDDALARKALYLSTQARDSPTRFIHNTAGYNYRLTNIQAAVGVAQLGRIDEVIAFHKERTRKYKELLSDIPGIEFRHDAPWAETNEWMVSILLPCETADQRDASLEKLKLYNIIGRPFFDPMSTLKAFDNDGNAPPRPVAMEVGSRGVNLPSSYLLTDDEIKHVCSSLRQALKGNGL